MTFIVRLWSRPDEFRAELKPLQGGESLYFDSATELVHFLEAQPYLLVSKEGLDA